MELGEPSQLILFPIWDLDVELRKVGECLGSVLCSSYCFYGGLNYHLAGHYVTVTKSATDDEFYKSARDAIDRFKANYADEDLQLLFKQAENAQSSVVRPFLQEAEKAD